MIVSHGFEGVILFEGRHEDVERATNELRAHFSTVDQESDPNVNRHRSWFEAEISTFPTLIADGITRAYRVHTSCDRYHLDLTSLINRHRDNVTIACAGIDTFHPENAVSIALYAPPDGRANIGFVGSLAGSRCNYLRVMEHLSYGGNTQAFMEALLNEEAIGSIPYQHRQQWSDSTSPLRVEFRSADPARNGWTLSFSNSTNGSVLVRDGFLPKDHFSVGVRTDWITALTILAHAKDADIDTFFDPDGQWMISGYALHEASIIDEALNPVRSLTAAQAEAFQVPHPVAADSAMVTVLRLYCFFFRDVMIDSIGTEGEETTRNNIYEHFRWTAKWLVDNGHIEPKVLAPGSQYVN
jgi:hypothetical protein